MALAGVGPPFLFCEGSRVVAGKTFTFSGMNDMVRMFAIVGCIMGTQGLFAQDMASRFDINELPVGAVITLPHEVTTEAPMHLRLQLHATEKRQLLKLRTIGTGGKAAKPVSVAIFDPAAPRVVTLRLKPGVATVYQIRSFTPVRIVPQLDGTKESWTSQRMILESDKPLGVSHENGENQERSLSEH